MVVRARWAVDIGLDSSVVEHLTSNAGFPGSIPGPAKYFHLYFFIYVNSPHHYHTRKVNFIGTSGYIIVHLVTIFVILEYIQTLTKLHCTFWWQAETMVTLNCLVDKAVAVS